MDRASLASRRVVLFGSGQVAQHLVRCYRLKIEYFADNDPARQGACIGNIPILAPEKLLEEQETPLIVVAVSNLYSDSIIEQLSQMGFERGKDFVPYQHLFPEEITAVRQISYLVNHRCNSRCKMCDIWKNNLRDELSAQELKDYLSNPYFHFVETFLLTGGEPSLSQNLPQYALAVSEALPHLRSFSINVNGLLPELTYGMASQIREILSEKGVSFFVGVSVDGIREVHDSIRGVPGAYERAFSLVKRLKENGFDVQVSATVMKDNLWYLDEFLSLLQSMGIEAMFKLVRRSETLNDGQLDSDVEDYSEDDLHQLRLFFRKVLSLSRNGYTPGFATYYQMIDEYLHSGKRRAGCSFASASALHIKQDGRIFVCANSTAPIELDEDRSANLEWLNKDSYRFVRNVLCEDCISDCMVLNSPELQELQQRESFFWKFFTLDYFYSHKEAVLAELPMGETKNAVLITGWYGTETVGDQAILGEICFQYRQALEGAQIYVTSMYPFFTRRTLKELGIDAIVVPLFSWDCLKLAASAKEVCMGGGPLMEMEILSIPLWLFSIAKSRGHRTRIYGCGMGPFLSDEKIGAVKELICLADQASFRDRASAAWAESLTSRTDIERTADPAKDYLLRRFPGHDGTPSTENILACFLREPTIEYRGEKTVEEYAAFQRGVEDALARNLKTLAEEHGLKLHFYSMHNFCVGGDDRDFAYRFAGKHFAAETYWVDNSLTGIDSVARAMLGAKLSVCMRFHSVLFADTLEVPFLAVDYTSGGKVFGYLKDNGKLERLVTPDDLLAGGHALAERMVL